MPNYPLIGPNVQSIFEYIKHEQEDIKLGTFVFDFLDFFGLPDGFNYDIDFFKTPLTEDGVPSPDAYGVISTCDNVCILDTIDVEYTFHASHLIAGPAIRIVSNDKDNATLYAALYNSRDHIIVFSRYVAQRVISYGFKLGVVFDINLFDGDIIKLRAVGTTYRIFLNNVLIIGPIVDTIITTANQCVGVIELDLGHTPVLKHIAETFETIYNSRVFYYCDDGISVNQSLTPATVGSNITVNNTSVILKSGQNGDKCYGFGFAQGFTDTDLALLNGRGYYTEFVFRYFLTPSGSPISGPAFLIDESKADPDDFTGWVVLINKKTGKLQLCYYLNESLSDLPDPSHIVAELTKSYTNDTLIKVIGAFSDVGSNTLWSINIFTRQPTDGSFVNDISYISANQLSPGDQFVLRKSRTNYGLAWVGNDSPGNHLAFWSGNASQQYALIN